MRVENIVFTEDIHFVVKQDQDLIKQILEEDDPAEQIKIKIL